MDVSFLRERHDFVEDTRATPVLFVELGLVARPVTVRVVGGEGVNSCDSKWEGVWLRLRGNHKWWM